MSRIQDELVQSARAVLVAYGATLGAFTDSVCTCDEPDCIYRDPGQYPVHVLLQKTANAVSTELAGKFLAGTKPASNAETGGMSHG